MLFQVGLRHGHLSSGNVGEILIPSEIQNHSRTLQAAGAEGIDITAIGINALQLARGQNGRGFESLRPDCFQFCPSGSGSRRLLRTFRKYLFPQHLLTRAHLLPCPRLSHVVSPFCWLLRELWANIRQRHAPQHEPLHAPPRQPLERVGVGFGRAVSFLFLLPALTCRQNRGRRVGWAATIEADILGDHSHARALDAGTKGVPRDIHCRVATGSSTPG